MIGFGFYSPVSQMKDVSGALTAICAIVATLKGFLDVTKWFVLLNPFVFLLVGGAGGAAHHLHVLQ